jgi:hypothetical protein
VLTKILVTHRAALKRTCGTRWPSVSRAVKRLIAADAKRGVATELVALDDAATMGKWRARRANARSFKDAIDHAFLLHNRPDYLVILGGPGVVPHQDMMNPLTGADKDDDPVVPSDLPYACEGPADDRIDAFVGPSRVVGRIPAPPRGKAAAAFLIRVLDNAASWDAPAKKAHPAFFGLSARVWRTSTTMSLKAMFGNTATAHTSPADGPGWSKADLTPRWHFINCHGAPADPKFYGQQGSSYPVAHDAGALASLIASGTVAAAECCYGAEIYDPALAAGPGICLTYLAEGAIAFLGSTTIAYGPADRNESADLLCRFFMESCLAGASTGRALLEARQKFAKTVAPISPADMKTLGQFLLLGDPSLKAIAPKAKPKTIAKSAGALTPHSAVRGMLAAEAVVLTQGTDSAASRPSGPASPSIHRALAAHAEAAGYTPVDRTETFDVVGAPSQRARAALTRKTGVNVRFHVLQAESPADLEAAPSVAAKAARGSTSAGVPKRMLLVGREVAGRVVDVQRLYSHAAAPARWHTPTQAPS